MMGQKTLKKEFSRKGFNFSKKKKIQFPFFQKWVFNLKKKVSTPAKMAIEATKMHAKYFTKRGKLPDKKFKHSNHFSLKNYSLLSQNHFLSFFAQKLVKKSFLSCQKIITQKFLLPLHQQLLLLLGRRRRVASVLVILVSRLAAESVEKVRHEVRRRQRVVDRWDVCVDLVLILVLVRGRQRDRAPKSGRSRQIEPQSIVALGVIKKINVFIERCGRRFQINISQK